MANFMKTEIHKSSSRGYANYGWLETRHTFSFSGYFNPNRIRFGALRVLNDDIIEGGTGFDTHPHDNMEIISIPVYGALAHKDSMGSITVLRPGEIQLMSAGSGLTHSEYNHLEDDYSNFLQVWIYPKLRDITPKYDQKEFPIEERTNQLQCVVSPDGKSNSLIINQDAHIYLSNPQKDFTFNYKLNENFGLYIFVIEGAIRIEDIELNKRDGIGISETDSIQIKSIENSELVLIEIPMVI